MDANVGEVLPEARLHVITSVAIEQLSGTFRAGKADGRDVAARLMRCRLPLHNFGFIVLCRRLSTARLTSTSAGALPLQQPAVHLQHHVRRAMIPTLLLRM